MFLDVDGVLNSYPVEEPRFKRERRRSVAAWRYRLHFRPKIVRGLEALVDARLADIVWLSTWSARCRTEIEPALSFRHSYPTIDMPDDSFNRYANDPRTWWKARAVERWLAEHPHDRAVWIDDDLAAPKTGAFFREKYGNRLLLVAPEFARGLDEDHLAAIRDFTYARPASAEPRRLAPLPSERTSGTRPARPWHWRRILHRGTYSGDNSGAPPGTGTRGGARSGRSHGEGKDSGKDGGT